MRFRFPVSSLVVCALVFCCGVGVSRGQSDDHASGSAEDSMAQARLAESIAKSLVRVEYTLQYDKGDAPSSDRWTAYRQYASTRRGGGSAAQPWEAWDQLIEEERPALRGGFLVGPTRVYTGDPMVHPRFIKSIKVRFGSQVVDATPAAYPLKQSGVFLDLAGPLQGAVELKFRPTSNEPASGPYSTVRYGERDGAWVIDIGSLGTSLSVSSEGGRFTSAVPEALVVAKDGAPVTIIGATQLGPDAAWKVSPLDWPSVNAADFAMSVEKLQERSSRCLLRVALNLRSPRSRGEQSRRNEYAERDESESLTEWNGTGVLVDARTVVVLAKFKPKVTGRLERIRVFDASGQEHAAKFAGSLREWGAFLATVDEPLTGAAVAGIDAPSELRDALLARAQVAVRGESRTSYVSRERITGFHIGRHGRVYPDIAATDDDEPEFHASEPLNFVFASDGSLVAVPVRHREKVSVGRGENAPIMVPMSMLTEELADRPSSIDGENRPLEEADENRLAWLGVELQGLDAELARVNNVSDQTEDGTTGAIITYVYENSPAAKAGLKSGDVLLRLHIEGQPKPLEISNDLDTSRNMQNFWQYLDQIPPEYFDRIPTPWPTAETMLTRSLTDVGFGTAYTAEVFRGGAVTRVELKIEQGPPHYDAAKMFVSEHLGITVREITYEVRRYFRLKPGDPGVIVSKVDKGGKCAVAGVKPYEIVTSINDQPVNNVADAEREMKAGGELRMAIKRMTQGRLVKIKSDSVEADGKAGVGQPTPNDVPDEK